MEKKSSSSGHELSTDNKCSNCGANIKYKPGTASTECEYCGTANFINSVPENTHVKEIDYFDFLDTANLPAKEQQSVVAIKCNSCGAQSTLRPNNSSDNCPFCGTALVIKNGTTNTIIRPRYLLPFAFDNKKANDLFKSWLGKGWFAPSDLQKYAANAESINGVYIPYWTFDTEAATRYSGRRGEDYVVRETYTTTVDGKQVERTRNVTHTNWYNVQGEVYNSFDDIMVSASKSLPEKYITALEPWDLSKLVDYNDAYLAGFRAEIYQVPLQAGFEKAKNATVSNIQRGIRRDIGGDRQEIGSYNIEYTDITFKHILLPVYISAYKYQNKVFRIMINARTGEVQGEKPVSAFKVFIAVIIGLLVAFFLIALFGGAFNK